MKVYIYSLLCTFIFCFSSCTSDVPGSPVCENKQQVTIENSLLIKSLEHINDSLLASDSRTRAKWTKTQVLLVAACDLYGAYEGAQTGFGIGTKVGLALGSPITGGVFGTAVGGILCGTIKSWMAAPKTRADGGNGVQYTDMNTGIDASTDGNLNFTPNNLIIKPNTKQFDPDSISLDASTLEEKYLNVGKLHNVMLGIIEGTITINDSLDTTPKDSIYTAIMSSQEMEAAFEDAKNTTASIDEIPADSVADYAIQLFINIFTEYSSSNEDVATIISRYLEAIENSTELSDEDKECIKYGMATALYSFNYWNVIYN